MKNHVPIYIISLSRTPERRLHIKRQLDSFGLQYHFVDVDVIDKYQLDSRAYRRQIAELLEIDETILENKYAIVASTTGSARGALAVTLSHIKIYDLMIKNNHSEVCILEDDATLLPAFPEVLKVAPERPWDILQLAHQPGSDHTWRMLKSCIYRWQDLSYSKTEIFLSFLQCWIRHHDGVDKCALKLYDFDNQLYPQQSKYIIKTIKEFRSKYRRMLALLVFRLIAAVMMPNANRSMIMRDYGALCLHTKIQLGTPFKKTSLQAITNDHCIAEPSECSLSTTAYMVRQSIVAQWKQAVLSPTPFVIDQIPYQLYQHGPAKLRLISPPCATATRHYLKYSIRTGW